MIHVLRAHQEQQERRPRMWYLLNEKGYRHHPSEISKSTYKKVLPKQIYKTELGSF